MATATATADDTLAHLPDWPTGPIEQQVMRELDHRDTIAALRDARDALARRRA